MRPCTSKGACVFLGHFTSVANISGMGFKVSSHTSLPCNFLFLSRVYIFLESDVNKPYMQNRTVRYQKIQRTLLY